MIKMISLIKEGGKLFGDKACRVTSAEMKKIFDEINDKIGKHFVKFELSKSLPSKEDHGDIDIIAVKKSIIIPTILKNELSSNIKDYNKNGNIYSILYKPNGIPKYVHIDIIEATDEEDFTTKHNYLQYNDFSGILGVMSRQLNFKYGTEGFFKIFINKNGIFTNILITKDLKKGLRILGYENLEKFDEIKTPDDIVNFISSSPLFDSSYYIGQTMNHSDRKRVRAGRPVADYIRKKLISLNKKRTIEDEDYFFKKVYPEEYNRIEQKKIDINNQTIIKSKYGGEWIFKNFPHIKPSPIIALIKRYWQSLYGDKIGDVPEEELYQRTKEFLDKLNTQ